MSAQELDRPAGPSSVEPDAPAMSDPNPKQSRFNPVIAAVGLIIILLLLLFIAAVIDVPNVWYVVFVAGLITGFTLGSVFGISIGTRLGNAPNFQRFSFATGIVVLNACIGFFAIPYLTTDSLWPRDSQALFWSIGTASTLVSAAILCLVNFFWHSRDQQRINSLRAVVNKHRARIAEAEAKVAAAQRLVEDAHAATEQQLRRAENAEHQVDDERKKTEQAQRETDQARTAAQGAQRNAQQAQHIAEKEKRWRLNHALLLGRWRCVEYGIRPKTADAEMGVEIQKELDKNQDVLVFGTDDRFSIDHPGNPVGLVHKLKSHLGNRSQEPADIPGQKSGRWTLDDGGESVLILFEDGARQTLKIKTLKKTSMTLERNSEQRDVLRFLVKIE
ncbi:MAG: hypothetical protein HY289_10875 [Planctomycetes bacterium]|nr:hypothetical protein [Planctomycetota bacterium]